MAVLFSYEDYIALVLIYTANVSEGISEEEHDFIVNKVGDEHYDKAFAFFETASEIDVIEMIDNLSDKYAREDKDKVLSDIKGLIFADGIQDNAEEQVFRMLNKII